jgi:hypothetical protein
MFNVHNQQFCGQASHTSLAMNTISLSLQTKTTHKVLVISIYGPLTAQLNRRQFTIELKELRALSLLSAAGD